MAEWFTLEARERRVLSHVRERFARDRAVEERSRTGLALPPTRERLRRLERLAEAEGAYGSRSGSSESSRDRLA